MSIGRSNFRVASLTHFKHYNLTTILITINLSTKERSYFKESLKNASASESTASMYAYVVPFPAYVSPFSIRNHPFSLLPIVPDNRKSILPTDVSHVSKLRTTYLRSVRHSPLSFIRNSHSNAIQKNAQSMSFFFSLSLSIKLRSQPFKPHLQPLPLDHRGLMHQCLPPPNTVKFSLSAITRGRRLVLCYRFNKKSKYGERSPINFNWLTDPRIII